MASNISKELIDMMFIALKKADPYPIEYLDEFGYDDRRYEDNYYEKDRVNATIAKKFLLENGINTNI